MGRKKKRHYSDHDPVLSRGIISIALIVFAILITLSFFDAAGVVGQMLNDYLLAALFGLSRYVTPLILLAFAWFVIRDLDYDYRSTHTIGALLFFLSLSSLMHIGFEPAEMWQKALDGNGGGIFGMPAYFIKEYLGVIAGVIVLLALIMVSLLLLFNTAITHFVMLHRKMFEGLGVAGRAASSIVRTLFVPKGSQGEEAYEDEEEEYDEEYEEDEEFEDEEEERDFAKRRLGDEEVEDEDEEEYEEDEEEQATPAAAPKRAASKKEETIDQAAYLKNIVIKKIPPVSLLSAKKGKPTSGDIKANQQIIKDTFADFRIDVDMGEVRVGPTVTQFTLKPPKGVKLSRMTSLTNNLALALAAHPIRMEAPIPGKSMVGIEVPNEKAAQVTLKELLEGTAFKKRGHNMMIALGKDVAGKVWFADLPKMPHLLIAGATGSGKTVCVNTIIMSLLYQNTAETLRMIMVDPKRVELTPYNGIPHLLTPVITNAQQTVNALKWTVGEMDRRFEVLSQAGNRDINTYNEAHPDQKLPHLVFIIDELADLMQSASNEVEAGIIRLAQMARAVGIHLILATQRPSVDVITGLMKANIPGRIAFSVASLTDSRTILDAPGAEKLLGRGDMLLATAALSKPVRIQGAFITEKEVKRIIKYLKGDDEPQYDTSILEKQSGGGTMNMFGGPSDDQDPLFGDAKRAILEAGKASASFLQRRLRVGYARAARILDELEEAGIIGPADGSKPREILVTETEIEPDAGGEFNVYDSPYPEDQEPAPASEEEEDDSIYEEDDDDEEEYEDERDDDVDEEEENYEDESDNEEEDESEEEDEEYEDEDDEEEYDDDDEEEEEEDDDDDEYYEGEYDEEED